MTREANAERNGASHTLIVRRTARFTTWGDLEGEWSAVWFVLHGYAQLARELGAACAGLASARRLVVAPEGLSRFYREGQSGDVGASWMTREEREAEVADTLGWLDALHAHVLASRGVSAPEVSVLGFSQGAAAAARWCVLGEVRPRRLVLWSAGLPPDLPAEQARERLRALELVLVAGESDPLLDAVKLRAERARLEALAPHARLERHAGGHRLEQALLERLADA